MKQICLFQSSHSFSYASNEKDEIHGQVEEKEKHKHGGEIKGNIVSSQRRKNVGFLDLY